MHSDRSVVHVRFTMRETLPQVGEVRESQGFARWRYRVLEILSSPVSQRGYVMVKMRVERWIIEEHTDAPDLELFIAVVLWYLSNEIPIAYEEERYRDYDELVQVKVWLQGQLVPGWKIP
jgi:hypothetical protein